MAEAANFQGDADNVGASAGADGASGAVDAPEYGQTLADVGGFDLDEKCVVQEGAPILNQSRQESPEPSVLKLCNFWRLLVVGGVPGPATRPFHLLRQPPSVLADGRKLGVSRKGPFGVWGCSRPPEMLRTPGFLHWVARKMY